MNYNNWINMMNSLSLSLIVASSFLPSILPSKSHGMEAVVAAAATTAPYLHVRLDLLHFRKKEMRRKAEEIRLYPSVRYATQSSLNYVH
jgi:hypothetical protein